MEDVRREGRNVFGKLAKRGWVRRGSNVGDMKEKKKSRVAGNAGQRKDGMHRRGNWEGSRFRSLKESCLCSPQAHEF